MKAKVAISVFILATFLLMPNSWAQAESISPELAASQAAQDIERVKQLPKGLLQLSGYKYAVYLYVPETIVGGKKYPFYVMVPSQAGSPSYNLELIIDLAKEQEIFVLVTENLWPEDTPYQLDTWLLGLKNEMIERFPINRNQVFVVGQEEGGHYAAYLTTAYPREFSGAALLGEAWKGDYFNKIMELKSSVLDQIPVLMAFIDPYEKRDNEGWIAEANELGYPQKVFDLSMAEIPDYTPIEFQREMHEWLTFNGQRWAELIEKRKDSFKERFTRGFHNFFSVEPTK